MPRNKIDYSNTVMYKIVCNNLIVNDLYVGYTTDFKRRKSEHKSSCHNINKYHYKFPVYQAIRNNGGWNNWTMVEIEKYPCNDGNEARSRERYWLEMLSSSLNHSVPNRTGKEYYYDNKDKIQNYNKTYYLNNKDYFNTKHKEYIELNKDKYKEYTKEYGKLKRMSNEYKQYQKEYNMQYRKEKIICICGSSYSKDHKISHSKTIKHCQFIANIKGNN